MGDPIPGPEPEPTRPSILFQHRGLTKCRPTGFRDLAQYL